MFALQPIGCLRGFGVVFFFQAEDGIRDKLVTGVQTCALPIYSPPAADLSALGIDGTAGVRLYRGRGCDECRGTGYRGRTGIYERSEEHTSELQSLAYLVCRLLLEKKKTNVYTSTSSWPQSI